MITINLLPSTASPSLYRLAVGQLQQFVQAGVSRFQPDTLIEQVQGVRERLFAAGYEAIGMSRLFSRFCDLYSDEELTADSAKTLLEQMQQGPLPGLIEGYEHLEPIGFGGTSRVYRGVESATGSLVAVKIGARHHNGNSPTQDSATLTRLRETFSREWDTLSLFAGSERIVQAHAHGTTDRGKPYIVMEYLPGGSLSNFIIRMNDPLDPLAFDLDQVLGMSLDAARAVAEVHQRGMIHNDIKAGNFLLTRDLRVKLADCSTATTVEEAVRNSHKRRHRGTPGFISPQTLESQKSDVLALGATLFALLTGKRAFNPGAIISTLLFTPPPPSKVRPEREIPPRFDKVVMKALHRTPTQRYANATEVLNDLEKITRKTPRPPQGPRRPPRRP
jgi:serine/threonine protein kinase